MTERQGRTDLNYFENKYTYTLYALEVS